MLNHLPTLTARPNARHLDLVFALDTICSGPDFEERRQFIKNVLQIVRNELQSQGQLNVGLIAYGPHTNRHSRWSQGGLRGISGTPLSPDLSLPLEFLHRQACQDGDTFEAAYEEVLHAIYHLRWKRSHHRVLVTVGHRPPHPFRQWLVEKGDPLDCIYQPSCEDNLDWRFLVAGMRSYLRMHSVAVVCPTSWPPNSSLGYTEHYARACWKEIGYTKALMFRTTSPEMLAALVLQLV
jgi:hypothetical protein